MPRFATFAPNQPPPPRGAGEFVINDAQDLDRFLMHIETNKNYDLIYINREMVEGVERAFNERRYERSPYKAAFGEFKQGPAVGAGVGFVQEGVNPLVANLGGRLQSVEPFVAPSPSAPPRELDDLLDEFLDPEPELRQDLDSHYEEDDDLRPNDAGEGDDDDIYFSPGYTPLIRTNTPDPLERKFGDIPRMSVEAEDVYQQLFSDDPFETLAELIEEADIELKEKSGSKNVVFRQHIQNILPVVMLAMAGAREEWRFANENNSSNKNELFKKMEAMEAVFKMLQSMEIMTTNRTQFSLEYYKQKRADIINKIGAPAGHRLANGLDRVVSQNVIAADLVGYNQRQYGLTAFDPAKPSQIIQGTARGLQIEHKRGEEAGSPSVVLTGKFHYNRKDVIGVQTGKFSGVKKIFAQRQDNLQEMKSQVAQFVNYALNDYGKGTTANPIYLQPSNSNQSELQLAILMEFKKRAYLEGRTLIASDDSGNRIKISPSLEFTTEEEKQYFAHFAMQVPKVRTGAITEKEASHCAAYHLFRDVKVDGKALKDHKDPSPLQMMEAMKAALNENVSFSIDKQKGFIDSAAKNLADRHLGNSVRLD